MKNIKIAVTLDVEPIGGFKVSQSALKDAALYAVEEALVDASNRGFRHVTIRVKKVEKR